MTFKDLLVHVDNTEACEGRLRAALALADAQGAHLTGLALAAETSMPSYIGGQLPPEILDMQRQQALERGRAAASRFAKAVQGSGRPVDCRIVESLDIDVTRVMIQHARHADLVVLGQPDPEEDETGLRQTLEEVILACGRPALVVPYIGAAKTLGERVVVAWDAGREAARAVNDALPILQRAKQVTVLSINPRPGFDGHGEEPGADIALHLARHDVKVEVQHSQGEEIAIGQALLSRLADRGADLLVMGVYGHSRLRELVLGGATRTILQNMTVPVFMSH
jgi:nucleotide-binding universal stress UspA family protein